MSKPALKAVREPTGAIMAESARIKLQPLGTPLRAQARAHSDGRLVLEAELPWLQLGAACTAELGDGRSIDGTVHWIGLDMTRDGRARLRILVDTNAQRSIQLSVSDADVEELMPIAKPKRRFRWMLPILTAGLAGVVGWFASHAIEPKPQLLAAPEREVQVQAPRLPPPPPVVKIPVEKAPEEIAFVGPPPLPTAPASPVVASTAKPIPAHKPVHKRR